MAAADNRPAGRPRDHNAGPALLEAARRLVCKHGYTAVSIQMIAEEAGVGRQTLYRRWPSKADLVLEAFLSSARPSAYVPGASVEAELRGFYLSLFEGLRVDAPAIRSLLASAQEDGVFLTSFRDRFALPRAAIVTTILENGIARGEIPPDFDIEAAVTLVHGGFIYPLILGETLDATLADRLVAVLIAGFRPTSRPTKPKGSRRDATR